jgi:hypothetical protein
MSWKRCKKRLNKFLKYEEDWADEDDQPISEQAAKVARQVISGDVSIFANRDGGISFRFPGVDYEIEPDGEIRLHPHKTADL